MPFDRFSLDHIRFQEDYDKLVDFDEPFFKILEDVETFMTKTDKSYFVVPRIYSKTRQPVTFHFEVYTDGKEKLYRYVGYK